MIGSTLIILIYPKDYEINVFKKCFGFVFVILSLA